MGLGGAHSDRRQRLPSVEQTRLFLAVTLFLFGS